MSDPSSSSAIGRVAALAESFLARYRNGERPAVAEYTARYPELAQEILAVFPAMVEMEQLGRVPGAGDGDATGLFAVGGPTVGPPIRQIGDYLILREIGRGGMGVVYEAEQASLGRHVALKVLPGCAWLDTKLRERFRREARAAARLHHTNIVPVFGVGEQEGTPYYVMQLIRGQALDEVLGELRGLRRPGTESAAQARPIPLHPDSDANGRIASAAEVAQSLLRGHFPVARPPSADPGGRMSHGDAVLAPTATEEAPAVARADGSPDPAPTPTSWPGRADTSSLCGSTRDYWRSVARIGLQAAEALHYAHSQGTLHRDIKPSNLLLDLNGNVWITDFGLAKATDEADLTRTGDLIGTLRYMAHERFRGVSDPLGDVYGLGMTMYELLTFGPAFAETDRERLIRQINESRPTRPSKLNPEVPRDLETIVLKAIDGESSRRYPTAGALAEDLQRFLDDRPIGARRASLAERTGRWCRRNPVVAGLTAVAAMLLIAVAMVSLVGYIQTSAALGREELARREAEGHLYQSLVGEARALRMARQDGYRRQVWDRLGRALRLAAPDRDVAALRREAAASLGDFVALEPLTLSDLGPVAAQRYPVLALHPRSAWIAAGLVDGTIRLYDRTTGRESARLAGPASPVTALAATHEGRLLIGHEDGTIRVVDEPASAMPRTASKARVKGRAIGFTRTGAGRTLVSARRRGVIAIRDLDRTEDEGILLHLAERNEGGENVSLSKTPAVAISPDGRRVAAGFEERITGGQTRDWIVLWDLATHEVLRRAPSPFLFIYQIAFSPDARRIAVGCDMGFAEFEADDLRPRMTAGVDSATSIGYGPDGRTLAVGTITRLVELWDLASNRELVKLRHTGQSQVRQVAFSDDGRTLVTGSLDQVRIWDLGGAAERRMLAGHAAGIHRLAFCPDGTMLATASSDRTIKLWDPATGSLRRTLGGQPGRVTNCAFSRGGTLLATGTASGSLHVWDTRRWEEVHASIPHSKEANEVTDLAFTGGEGGNLLVATLMGLQIWRIDNSDGRPIALEYIAELPGRQCFSVALSPDCARAALSESMVKVRLWDVVQGRELPFSGPDLLLGWQALAFRSPRELVSISRDGVAVIWYVIADRLVRTIGRPGTFEGFHIAVSSDGRWLAAESTPSSVGIIDLVRGEVVLTFREERSPIWSLAWSPDARRLAVGLTDGGLCLWDLHEVQSRLDELGLGWK